MKKLLHTKYFLFFTSVLLLIASCNSKSKEPSMESIKAINLKRGDVVLCGPPDEKFGAVAFETSCSEKVKKDFDLAISILHSFEYDEAEKVFTKIIDEEPSCAMAYWGVAMCNYHPLWAPPTGPELEKGAKAIAIAKSITQQSKRESDYIEAMALFYKDRDKADHRSRSINYRNAMEKIYTAYPRDKEASIFYALSLTASADPADKSFSNQKQAYNILTALYPGQPHHPGIVHYIIHSYDYPELAASALTAARKYAAIAPSSAHAQHMPSHIFTRLGLWDECINSNLVAASAAQCYAESAGIKGHWDEELHAMDYLVYAYLQKGDNVLAKKQWDYLKTINEVHPFNFKVAYAFASIPARYVLENKMWAAAAGLNVHTEKVPWQNFPWQKAIIHFARVLGAVHTGKIDLARSELQKLNTLHDTLVAQKDDYKANQVMIQVKTAEAWILFKEGKTNEALKLMNMAADMEDHTEKHPVTPAEVIPALELLGDMLMQMNKPDMALQTFEASLKKHPNRFNAVYGAGSAAEKNNNLAKANFYYTQLISIANAAGSNRPELETAKIYLKK
ncbi:MAG: tetratricopeptide repeat protein [Ferruginibacter sp.]